MDQPKRIMPLQAGQRFFAPQAVAHNVYCAYPQNGESIDDVLRPEFWRNHCGRVRSGDFIEVLPEGMEWHARLVVVYADQFTIKVKMISHARLSDYEAVKERADGFKVDRVGRWWRVIRISDQSVMKSGLTEESEALAWIEANCEA